VLYLRRVGPAYGALGFGTALYFPSQGAGRLRWPIAAGLSRLAITALGGWAVTRGDHDALPQLCWVLAVALIVFAAINLVPWSRQLAMQRARR
jgi:hypothetical protein